jgi:integrase
MVLVRDRKDPRQKKGNDQWVPLIRGSWEIVNSQPVTSGGIFPSHPQTLSKLFKAVCDRLGIVDLHLHDLRHHSISEMFESGMRIEQVALVSGHKDWRHLRTYTNLKPESLVALDAHRDRPLRPARLHIVSHRRGKS